jgi:uncharacterized surface protein with fasciclin (FAS1) repeats
MPDLVDTAINAGSFTTLVTAITTAGLDTALKGPGPFTVFAPTDEAFSKLPSGTVESLLQDILTLRKVLEYHVASGELAAPEISQIHETASLEGSTLQINGSQSTVKINDANVVTANVEADNGIIHVIDTVLIPPSVSL